MKKIIASAVGIIMVGGVAVTTASAFESKFGGYWRTRVFSQSDFNGVDSSYNRIDNRTRLYYTAMFSEDFKFVNKFEHNTNWGDDVGGDIGADGMGIFRIKNSYADFNLGAVNTKLGIFGSVISRGFLFDDDASGAKVTMNFGNVSVPLQWIRVNGEYVSDAGVDEDILYGGAKIGMGDAGSLTPFVVYHGSSGVSELEALYLGIDADMKFGEAKTWGSFIYQGGTNAAGQDNKAWLGAVGASWTLVHGQFFYATGNGTAVGPDDDNEEFAGVPGRSYYWAEIMGMGTFDNQTISGGPGNAISNVFAANVGVKVKPVDKWTLSADLWYVQLAESNALGNDELGTELDVKATYKVMDNLNLDLVAAYLFAGDAAAAAGETNQEDPVEIGARLSLSF